MTTYLFQRMFNAEFGRNHRNLMSTMRKFVDPLHNLISSQVFSRNSGWIICTKVLVPEIFPPLQRMDVVLHLAIHHTNSSEILCLQISYLFHQF